MTNPVTVTVTFTLLNCTYKLLSMILVQRLIRVLQEVITSSQLAVPGKKIMSRGHNLVIISSTSTTTRGGAALWFCGTR